MLDADDDNMQYAGGDSIPKPPFTTPNSHHSPPLHTPVDTSVTNAKEDMKTRARSSVYAVKAFAFIPRLLTNLHPPSSTTPALCTKETTRVETKVD
jgi:hypothetical protein